MRRGGSHRPIEKNASEIDNQFLFALINNLSDAVLAADEAMNVVVSNGAALSMLNCNELKNQPLNKALPLIDKSGNLIDLHEAVQNTPHGFNSRELRLKSDDGNMACVYFNISPVKLGFGLEGGGYVVIMRDITAEKLVEDERDDFINVAGHELRTPVAIAEGSISNVILLAERAGVNNTLLQSLKTAHDQVIFLSSMINDLAVLSRADRGKLAMNVESLKISELVEELSSSYTPQAQKKSLTISFEVANEAQQLNSSRLYVSEILQNFITNSIKYTAAGGIKVEVSSIPNGVRFSVTDTGFGISQDDQRKLLEKFFRSSDDRVKSEKGTGLGLFITGKLIKLLEARLTVHSQLNIGSTFSVDFPNLELSKVVPLTQNPPQAQPLAN